MPADELPSEDKVVSIEEFSAAINQVDDRSQEFWDLFLDEAISSFERGIKEVQETRNKMIELIKLDLLIGSFFIAVLQYGFPDNQIPSEHAFLPFAILVASILVYIYSYFVLDSHVLGPSSSSAYESLITDQTSLKYQQITAVVYYKWGDSNMQKNHRATRYMVFGISLAFMSLGAFAALFAVQ